MAMMRLAALYAWIVVTLLASWACFAQIGPGVMMASPPASAIIVPVQVVFEDSNGAVNVGNPTSFTMNLGTASANRYIVVAVGVGHTGGSISAVTVGGIGASRLGFADNGFQHSAVFQALVPTGTSASVVITHGAAGNSNFNACTYAWLGMHPNTTGTIQAAANSGLITVPGGGAAIGAAYGSGGGIAWTGMTKDVQISNITPQFSCAHTTTFGINTTVSVTGGSTALTAAAWGP